MRRTRAHVLEDESEKALKDLLPSEWIFRKKSHDYGIDLEIALTTWSFRSQPPRS